MRNNGLLFLLFILLFSFTFSYENKFTVNGDSNKLNLSNTAHLLEIDAEYTRLAKLGDGHTTEPGFPELPNYTTFYQLDPTKLYEFKYEVLDSYIIEDITVLPHQGMERWEVENVNIIEAAIYDSYEPYPVNNMIISDRIEGRGIEFVSIQVTPYKYFPKYNRLEVYTSIDILVEEIGDNPEPGLVQTKRSHIFDEYYKGLIVNFTSSDREEDYQASSILYIAGGNWLNNSYVQDLLEWRHKQGYIVNVYDTPSSNENTIKNYIKDAYETWDNPPEIVGLIGDTDVIDCFYQSWGTGGWNSYNGSTDADYTYLAGNDFIPEVFIGRISAQGQSTMDNVVNKTIQYEKALHVGNDWFRDAALVGDPSQSGNSTIFTSQYIENIMINYGMGDVEGYYVENGIENWLIDKFNEGILYYNYRGIYGDDGTDFSELSSDISNGYMTPFATVMTCGTGDFDQGNSQSEEFFKYGSVSNPKGAVGAIGLATTGTHTAYNNILNMGIYDGIFSKDLWYAGAAEANGDIAMIATYPSNPGYATEAFTSWSNLIGDPALHLWTGVPTNFAVDYIDNISLGTTAIQIIVYDEFGAFVEGARVTLLMGDDVIFTTGMTDGSGEVSLSWDAIESGTMDITVIKRNHRPYEGTIEISSSAGSAVSMVNENIEVLSGEATDLNILFQNYGTLISEDVYVALSSSSEYISIHNDEIFLGDISPQEIIQGTFSVSIHGTAFHMEDLDLMLTIRDKDENVWINSLPVDVLGPYVSVSEYLGDIYPGSETEIIFNIDNMGSRSAEYTVELLSYENLISTSSNFSNLTNLDVGENMYLDGFDVSFSSDIINGTVLPVDLILTSSDGYNRNLIVNIMVGETRETDPVGPDAYGYYIYGQEDIDYDLAPEYDWIEIAEGVGEQLNLVDYGNGNYSGSYSYSSATINLPFIFTFYGIDYDNIVVNTNGWISFGDFEMYSFRNYPIPGAGGPSPMVAAFWDDLKISSNGNVYYAEFDDYVVVQWNNMRTYDNNDNETFQMILFDKSVNSPTITGDSEIKIQYKDFNNTSNGYYPTGGTPTHGCYSTIGIENHLGDIGLQYSFNNTYADGAPGGHGGGLTDNSAIFITTGADNSSILGDLNQDDILNILDVVILVNIVLDNPTNSDGDLNDDGIANILDVVILVNLVLG